MELTFVPRAELADFEWSNEKQEWSRPRMDAATLKELNERSSAEGFLRVLAHTALLVGSALLTIYSFRVHVLLAIPPFLFYSFLVGFLNGIEHEMRHKIVFSRSLTWFSDAVYFLIHVLFRQGTRYQTISHRTHHRYTMIRGVDPETPFPDQLTTAWVKKTLRGLFLEILTLGIPSFFKALFTLAGRVTGRIEPLIRNQCSEKDIRAIRLESLVIIVINLAILAVTIWLQRWDLLALLILGPQVGGAIVAFWWMTEHIGMMYNTNDQRLATRGVKVGPFVKFLYGGLDEHVEHHLFPAVPSRNLGRLRAALNWPIPERVGVVACWREILAIAARQEESPDAVLLPCSLDTP
jgi:fatty acid desaturase